ncbi:hypothetical protein ZWY2020_035909 [Hordeum vulgare]|nr:hypothetical protein ZWY2020_035909 [Hordeum vulgare]
MEPEQNRSDSSFAQRFILCSARLRLEPNVSRTLSPLRAPVTTGDLQQEIDHGLGANTRRSSSAGQIGSSSNGSGNRCLSRRSPTTISYLRRRQAPRPSASCTPDLAKRAISV